MFGEPVPKIESSVEKKVDVFSKERSRLRELATTPAAKWVTVAALALSTQGCKQFVGVVTGEGTAVTGIRGLSIKLDRGGSIGSQDEAGQHSDVQTSESGLFLQGDIRKPGDIFWWRKGEGLYVPPSVERKVENRKKRELELGKIPRISFENEKPPRIPVSYAQPHPGELPGDVMRRGYEMLAPVLAEEEGVRIQWHVAQLWDKPMDQTGTNAVAPVPMNRKRILELMKAQHALGGIMNDPAGSLLLGQFIDLDHASSKLTELMEGQYPKGPVQDVAIRCSPLLPMETSAIKKTDFEAYLIELAKTAPGDFAFVSNEPSPRKEGFVDHAGVVVQAGDATPEGRADAVGGVAKKLSMLGLNETRIHILYDNEGNLKVVGVLDNPAIKVPEKGDIKYAF